MGEPSNTLTFDQDPPRRPGVDDLGDEVQNDPEYPPKVGMPTAEMFNQLRKLAIALGGLMPVAIVSIRFNAGDPLIDLYVDVRSVDATPTPTDNGTGDTSIVWPANAFPAPAIRPGGFLNADLARSITVEPISNGVRVRTRDAADTSTDCAFTVFLY